MWALQLICWTVALCSTSSGVLARFQDHSAHLIKRSAQSPDLPENVLPKLYHLEIQPYLEEGTFSGSMRITVTCKRPTYNITLRAGDNLQVTDSVVKQTQTESSEDGDVKVSGVRRSNDDLLILDLEQSLVEGREYQLKIPFSGSLSEGRLSGRFYRDSYIDPLLGDKRLGTARLSARASERARERLKYKIEHIGCNGGWPHWSERATERARLKDRTDSIFRARALDPVQSSLQALGNIIKKSGVTFGAQLSRSVCPSVPFCDEWYALTDLSTSSAQYVFPCFSNDSLKTPFLINIVRKDNLSSLSNMPLLDSQDIPNKKGWTLDRYQMTPPMSPSSVYIFVSNFKLAGSTIIQNTNGPVNVSVYGQENLLGQLSQVSRDVSTLVKVAQRQFGVSFPLPALSIIALPKEHKTATNHSGWGVVPIQDNYLNLQLNKLYCSIVDQWFQHWATPQHDTSTIHVKKIIADYVYRQYLSQVSAGKTYIQDDLWHAMSLAADEEEGFPKTLAVKTIINSWFTQDYIPLVEVNRTYSNNSAIVEQHILSIDLIPSKKDDIRWVIPLIYLTPKNLDGDTARPAKWMEQKTQVELSGLPSAEDFIIVNPVEGSLFMVNYDTTNWNLLADYIRTSLQNDSLPQIDRVTRTKVIQDTFNLAFSEKLDYGVTLNMSRALQYERDNLVWFQVNNLFLHLRTLLFGTRAGDLVQVYTYNSLQTNTMFFVISICRNYKSQFFPKNMLLYKVAVTLYNNLYKKVSYKFIQIGKKMFVTQSGYIRCKNIVRRYFLFLLNSAIERGIPNTPNNQEHTLCKLADPDCIRSKQNIYDDWMNNDNSIKTTPLSTTLCPVLTSGTDEEFDYGLRAMLNKTSNERLRILRCLASGCLTSSERMERFENKRPAVWKALIKAATNPYLTEKGHEKLESFYKSHEGEFGEQEELVKGNLRDSVHLTAKWEGENLPTIVSWVQDNWDGNRVVTKLIARDETKT
uniref:Aminopeptidase n=1 Tax=Timema monikensis TaxID=170555 RepID=A0A7R9E1R2_9NEOP|nr:unnamed protein product [Timema monikensis]